MSEPIELVVFSKMGGPLTKRITLTADGKIASDGSACTMARGRARRVLIDGMDELAALIEGLNLEIRPLRSGPCATSCPTRSASSPRPH